MHTKKVILVSIILRRGSFSRFLKKLKDSRNMKKKDKIFILSKLSLPLGANNLIFWHFLTCCYCKKKKIIKNIDWRTIHIAINRNWNINRTWSVSVISNIKMVIWNYHQYYKMKWWASWVALKLSMSMQQVPIEIHVMKQSNESFKKWLCCFI